MYGVGCRNLKERDHCDHLSTDADNKRNLKETERQGMNWIHLIQNGDK
jgi:hypothetical protein